MGTAAFIKPNLLATQNTNKKAPVFQLGLFYLYGGEGGIRTLDAGLTAYSLSRGAPSATRPPLRDVSSS